MFKQKLAQFFQGRNGTDALCRFLNYLGMGLLILSLILTNLGGGRVSSVLWGCALAAIVYCWFRALSKNIYKRQAENYRYLAIENRVKARFRNARQRWRDRKTYKYFRCPSCKATLRVPRGKGTLQITCRKCGHKFKGNS